MWTNIEVMAFIVYLLIVFSIWIEEDSDNSVVGKLMLTAITTAIAMIILLFF